MIKKTVQAYGKRLVMACDGRCDKAWGINARPRAMLSKVDEDDYVFVADQLLGDAPEDPGTYEGGDGKPSAGPISDASLMNKWCLRECERSAECDEGEEPELPDMSNPEPNAGWR